jgi:BTB/POZ domain
MSQSSQYKDEKDVASRIKGLLSPDDALSDTVLLCAGGAQLRAHSLVLALHSPVFHGLLAAAPQLPA